MSTTVTFSAFVLGIGVTLTPAQRVLARVAFDGVEPGALEGVEREIATSLFGPIDEIPSSARAVLVAVCGARAGKSYLLGGLFSLWRALVADLSSLAPGEVAIALVVAPDLRLARQVLRYALGAARSVPAIARCIEAVASDSFSIRRPDGAVVAIEALPATRGGSAVRGRSLVSAVLDEAAFFRDESAAVNDVEVFRAAAPRVLPGGLVVVASTPWVEAGLLYDEFSRNFATPKTALAVHAATELLRPDDRTRSMVARERDRDAANAEREFGAQFITGGSGLFFGPELLSAAVDRDLSQAGAAEIRGRAFVGGDVGLVTDASAFVAVREHEGRLVVVDMLEIRPAKGRPLKLSEVIRQACVFADRNGSRTIIVDHHELQAGREHLLPGFTLKPCAGGTDAKEDRFLRCREAFRQERLRIPGAFVRLATQLALVVAKPKPGGGTQIILPRRAGTHLDLCSAFVLALSAARSRRLTMAEALSDPAAVARFKSALSGVLESRTVDPYLRRFQ